ncbi:hypothetical protein RhiJN_20511 [Ceratobasidium sp. AG-Ba]|nr:hypothetical protein RhiJN_20511 [Ceratobasidium sp. AG-Ba]
MKPKPPTWVTSEFGVSSANKSSTTQRLPQVKDRSTFRIASGTTNSFISPNLTPDLKTKKPTLPTSFAAQPAPSFAIPKPPQTDPQNRTDDPSASISRVPAFRTNDTTRTIPSGLTTPKDAAPMPPPPRIEPKQSGHIPNPAVKADKDFIPLTNLITPRLFGLELPAGGKGNSRVASSNELPISDDPFIDQLFACPAIAAEDIEADAEVFTMRELARGLNVSPNKKGRTGSTRQVANKFIKGGLAARASALIAQREKDDALWLHHKTSKLTSNPSLREDMRVNVVERLQSIGESVLARCEVCPADAARLQMALMDDTSSSGDSVQPNLVDLLLSRPGSKGAVDVEPGMTVRLWKPWIEVDLNAAPRSLPSALDGERIDAQPETRSDEGTCADHKKEECPIRYSDGQDQRPYSKNLALDLHSRRALLCSRYTVG